MQTDKIKSTLLKALREAGRHLVDGLAARRVVEKKSELSLVTETDHASERAILKIIRADFPDHAYLTEESPAQGLSASRWIIDPLDGTTNFAHTHPVACVSIAFEHEGQIELGGVYDPFRNELFFAQRGQGAAMNGNPIAVSQTPILSESLLATGFPYDRRKDPDSYLAAFRAFMMKVQGIRRAGAAALDLCYVACGRYDGFWETKLCPWDKAAGMLIVQEAGGRVTNFEDAPLTLDDVRNAASNGRIHGEMLEVLSAFPNLGK